MNIGGPQQFELQAYDSGFQTHDPAAPGVGVDIQATVGVTVNWNDARTALATAGVQYDPPSWQDPGAGPFTIYDDVIGGPTQPVGTVRWSVVSKTLSQREADAAGARTRWVVTPTVQLFRQITRTDGQNENHSVYTASATVYSNWS